MPLTVKSCIIALDVILSVCDVIAVLTIKSVFAIPVRPEPSPTKLAAVMIPTILAFVETCNMFVVVIPVTFKF